MPTRRRRLPQEASAHAASPRAPDRVSVRMYNVGFGDCFLVTIPVADGTRRILFDCGSVAHAPAVSMDDILQQLWQDATDPGTEAPRIDVIVATHRHRDHVSGFAKPGWEAVRVQEVWLPWTEHPTDCKARRIRETQSRLAATLSASLAAQLQVPELLAADRARLESGQALALNALSNERAMTTLHEGFAGNPKRRFLPEAEAVDLRLETDVLPGVTVYILGPSRDPDVIRDMEPPVGESYLRLASSLGMGRAVPAPFAADWRITPASWAEMAAGQDAGGLRSAIFRFLSSTAPGPALPELSPADQETIAKMGDLEQGVAVALDKAVNGTSLMIVLKIGQAHLLFPGDAQWGLWQAALQHPFGNALLRQTRFFKVAHHGSHNGTPREFVEEIIHDKKVWSMVSTGPMKQWPEIPKAELLDALTSHGGIYARSDKAVEANQAIFEASGERYIDMHIPLID